MSRQAVILGSGVTARPLWRLVSGHPEIELTAVASTSKGGKLIGEIDPGARSLADMQIKPYQDAADDIARADIVFSTLHNEPAAKLLPDLQTAGKLIDLSGAHRLPASDYPEWYGFTHPRAADHSLWQYGLPELFRDEIASANRIANPGCFATASILAIAPWAAADTVDLALPIAIKGVTGISGAGGRLKEELLAVNNGGQTLAYRQIGHQHIPEIEQAIKRAAQTEVKISFSPSTSESIRGIEVTAFIPIKDSERTRDFPKLAEDFYRGEPFVEVLPKSSGTASVNGSNVASIALSFDNRTGLLIVNCVIDNLVKGAAGQAVQNANIMLGFPETTGLPIDSFFPGT